MSRGHAGLEAVAPAQQEMLWQGLACGVGLAAAWTFSFLFTSWPLSRAEVPEQGFRGFSSLGLCSS